MVFIYNVYYRIDYFDDEIYNSPELDQNKPIYTTAASCLKVPISLSYYLCTVYAFTRY